MKAIRWLVASMFIFSLASPFLVAQDKPNATSKTSSVSLKLQVTIVEREGDKKVTNLPYTFFVRAGESGPASPGPGAPWTKLRTGSRVPVATGGEKGSYQFQYIDVGTNIDARAFAGEDGRFDLWLNLERSWVSGEVEIPADKATAPLGDTSVHFKEPIIRQFKTELTMPMRDGQTSEITQAADPTTGRILTISVTMNVVK